MVLYTENFAHIWSTTSTLDLMLNACTLRRRNPSQTAAVMVVENNEIGQTMALFQQSSLFPSPPHHTATPTPTPYKQKNIKRKIFKLHILKISNTVESFEALTLNATSIKPFSFNSGVSWH